MQVSTYDTCFLFRLNHLGLPDFLEEFLQNDVLKIGLSLKDDFAMLRRRNQNTSSLKSGVKTLKNGTSSLSNGTKSLFEGVGTLKDGSAALVDGVKQLNDGAMTLSKGMKKFKENGEIDIDWVR